MAGAVRSLRLPFCSPYSMRLNNEPWKRVGKPMADARRPGLDHVNTALAASTRVDDPSRDAGHWVSHHLCRKGEVQAMDPCDVEASGVGGFGVAGGW